MTDDDRGIARDVAADLKAQGLAIVRVRHGVSKGDVEGVNLTSSAAVDALVERVRAIGPLVGVIHALPLRARQAALLDPDDWSARVGPETRGLFLLAKAAADDLQRASENGGACLIAAAMMGGAFAVDDRADDFFPGHGGVAGLIKTLAREWPKVRARVVDFPSTANVEVIAADLVREIWAADRRGEIGYRGGDRVGLRVVKRDLESPQSNGKSLIIRPGDPILMTGGARNHREGRS